MVARFRPEPTTNTPSADRTGILLCNLGTPDAPTTAATRRYLAEFLSDPRVVEIPALVWKPLLHGIILRTRPAKSAAKYQTVWTPEGSPLAVWTDKQAKLLRGWLGEAGHNVLVRPAMRYGNPSIASQLDAFKAEGVRRVLVLPLYPQYSATTTASVIDAVNDWCATTRDIPEIRFVNSYHRDPGYIAALAASVRKQWQADGRAEKLVMSFHGIPDRKRILKEGDIISVDVGAVLDGFHGDAARTYPVGTISREALDLIRVTEECFWKGFDKAIAGNRIGDVSYAVMKHAEEHGYGVVRELTGHGIGRHLHEDPDVPNYGKPGHGPRIVPGLVIAVEPMINMGSKNVAFEKDGWTVRTKDRKPSAHFEHCIAIRPDGPQILSSFKFLEEVLGENAI